MFYVYQEINHKTNKSSYTKYYPGWSRLICFCFGVLKEMYSVARIWGYQNSQKYFLLTSAVLNVYLPQEFVYIFLIKFFVIVANQTEDVIQILNN